VDRHTPKEYYRDRKKPLKLGKMRGSQKASSNYPPPNVLIGGNKKTERRRRKALGIRFILESIKDLFRLYKINFGGAPRGEAFY
jgi:hypothetical protein